MRPRLGTCSMDSWSSMLDPESEYRHGHITVMFWVLTHGNKLANGVGLVNEEEDGLALASVQLLLLLLLLQFRIRFIPTGTR